MGKARGIATLEMASLSILLSMLLFTAVAVTDYLDQLRRIHAIAELHLNDTGLKPFSIQAGYDTPAPELRLNREALAEYLSSVTAAAVEGLDGRAHLVEAKYAVAEIDEETGAFRGFEPAAALARTSGTLPLPPAIRAFTDLDTRFDEMASGMLSDASRTSLIALPMIHPGQERPARAYLDRSLLVGLRIAVSLEGSLTGTALELIGQAPIVYTHRIIQLRGVIQ